MHATATTPRWSGAPPERARPLPWLQQLLERLFLRLAKGASVTHVRTHALSQPQVDALWRCYSGYVDRPRADFERVLAHSSDVILFHHPGGDLLGFEAFRIMRVFLRGRACVVVYTVFADLERRARGHNFLQMTTLGRVLLMLMRYPQRDLHWVWTSSTYLSYLLLPRNLAEFWPRREHPEPPFVRDLLDHVFTEMDLEGWDPVSFVLSGQGKLRYKVGIVDEDRPDDPDAQFFAARNPGQAQGDALACLIPVNAKNILALARSASRRWGRIGWGRLRRGRERGPRD